MKSRFAFLLLVTAVMGAPALHAADSHDVRSPVLGFVLDAEAGTLHRVDGIPGASRVGDALDLGFAVARAQIAASQDFAIVTDTDGLNYWVNLSMSPPTAIAIDGALAGATGLLISPSGRSAALYSIEDGQIQFIEGLPGAPTVGQARALIQGVGTWTAFAISDMGVVLAASSQGRSGSLYALSANRPPYRVGSVQRASDLSFLPGGNDAVVADSDASEIVLIRSVSRWPRSMVLATAHDRVTNPFNVEATADGQFVAATIPGGIASIPTQGGAVAITKCACEPTDLAPLAGGNVFRLTTDIRAPMRIVEVGSDSRVLFVPALAVEESLVQ